MLTPNDVISAYKLVLGREPESQTLIDNFVKHSNFDHLRKSLLGSSEFAELLRINPHLLSMRMLALTMAEEVQRHLKVVETVIALALPIYDQSVLLVGDDAASFASFYVDRRCKVSIAAPVDVADFLHRLFPTRSVEATNIEILSREFSQPFEEDDAFRFDLVQGELPDDRSDTMRAWLDNAAVACRGMLIVTCQCAPGGGEEVYVTPSPNHPERMHVIPTCSWVGSRLRERFEHVYRTVGLVPSTRDVQANMGATRRTYVASRRPLNSHAIEELSGTAKATKQIGAKLA